MFLDFKCHRSFSLPTLNVRPALQLSVVSKSQYFYMMAFFLILLPSGARGDTRRAIERAVCVPHDFHCVHFQLKKLKEKLASSLQMASQIYYNPRITITVWSFQRDG